MKLAQNLNLDHWEDDAGLFNIGVKNQCVLALTFDEGVGQSAADSSGHGNDATIYPAPSAFTFGRTDTGTSNYTGSANYKYSNLWQAGATGTISKIRCRLKRNTSSGKGRCMIYADNAGSPGALIAQTQEATISTSTGWVDFPFSTPVSVVNGTYYWLAVFTDQATTIRYNNTTGTMNYNADTYSDGAADPFGSPTTSASHEICIYASGSTPPATWVTGKYGYAISLDGSSNYLQIPDSESLTLTSAVTIAIWVKLIAYPATNALIAGKDLVCSICTCSFFSRFR